MCGHFENIKKIHPDLHRLIPLKVSLGVVCPGMATFSLGLRAEHHHRVRDSYWKPPVLESVRSGLTFFRSDCDTRGEICNQKQKQDNALINPMYFSRVFAGASYSVPFHHPGSGVKLEQTRTFNDDSAARKPNCQCKHS